MLYYALERRRTLQDTILIQTFLIKASRVKVTSSTGDGNGSYVKKLVKSMILLYGKKFLLPHFFGQVLNRKNPSFIRASLLSEEYFISPRFYLLEFKITSNLDKYFCGFIHV